MHTSDGGDGRNVSKGSFGPNSTGYYVFYGTHHSVEPNTNSSRPPACRDGEWVCADQWLAWREMLFVAPVQALKEHMSADTIALIAILSTVAACCIIGCTCAHRRSMQRGVRKLEEELARARGREIELARARGNEDAANLRDRIKQLRQKMAS